METKPTIYTRDFVAKELASMLDELILNDEIIYKGELFLKKPYSGKRYSEWATTFKEDDEISETVSKIDYILESRAVAGAMKQKLSTNMVKFHLINNFGWRDEKHMDHTSGGKPIPILGALGNKQN